MSALWWLLWAAVAAALAWQVRRALREPSERDRIVCEATAYAVGPDLLLLLQDLDAHLDAHAAQLAPLYELLGPPDPSWDAGRERLWDAVRDEHTNTPEGD